MPIVELSPKKILRLPETELRELSDISRWMRPAGETPHPALKGRMATAIQQTGCSTYSLTIRGADCSATGINTQHNEATLCTTPTNEVEMGLRHQIQRLMGKDRRSSNLTAYKNRGQVVRLCDLVYKIYGLQNINHLKTKHIIGAFDDLKARGLGSSSLASYATAARIIADAIGKQNIVPRTNRELGISRAGERLKPVPPNYEKISQIKAALFRKAEWLGLAAEMREKFGVRAKESILSHELNEHGQLVVRGSKGGRPRTLDVQTPEQRELIARVQRHIQEHDQKSLLPKNMTLKQGLKYQSNVIHRLGGTKSNNAHPHASRHMYAQERAREGASREQISEELGHARRDVVSHYVK